MKKIVGIMAAAALATSAFAEINVSSWGRMDVIPLNFVGEDANGDKQVYAGSGAPWSKTLNETGKDGVSFGASSENAGMALDIAYAGSSLGVGDNANLWVKPVDMLQVTFGKVDYNNGRQNFCYGAWDHSVRFQGDCITGGEGLAVSGRGVSGFVLKLTPIEGLWIDYAASVKGDAPAYKTLWSNASLGIGYDIEGIGNARVIVFGRDGENQQDGSKDKNNVGASAVIQAGFDLTAVENLFVTFGASIPTTFGKAYGRQGDASYAVKTLTKKEAAANAANLISTITAATDDASGAYLVKTPGANGSQGDVIGLALGARYTLNPVTFHALFNSKIGVFSGIDKDGAFKNDGFGYAIGAGVDFSISDSLTLITDARFCNSVFCGVDSDDPTTSNEDQSQDAKYIRGKFGAYVGLSQALTNATFDFGVQLGANKGVAQAIDNNLTVAVPLQVTVSF